MRTPEPEITFTRLSMIAPENIIAHMSDPRMREHMPLLTFQWDHDTALKFIAAKEESWAQNGLGHWAILANGDYVGWGGFQKEGDTWDYGLVLTARSFGLGHRITKQAIDFARADARIPFITFLLPPSRKNLKALTRLGAFFIGETEYAGARFLKYQLDTPSPRPERA